MINIPVMSHRWAPVDPSTEIDHRLKLSDPKTHNKHIISSMITMDNPQEARLN